ncbi:MAG: DUF3179 domain-containing protein [Phycisphaeraceae bacterium]|nr:MAG: DUF3179 domain-containing protein [Phycisphaeraceae bacterium]
MTSALDAPRTMSLRDGGWVLLVAGGLVVVLLIWGLAGALLGREKPLGDGVNPATYGFDLTDAIIPVRDIVAAAEHREAIRPLDHPAMIDVAEVNRLNAGRRTKYLVPGDRVIGIVLHGEARCYPVRMLAWHEVVNDTVGGVPIAVTYNGLCDSIVVFDRRGLAADAHVSGAGVPPVIPSSEDPILLLRASGLLHNANTLLYAALAASAAGPGESAASGTEPAHGGVRGGESLWSQLRMKAVTGPAARDALTLRPVPFTLARWADWSAAYPDTLVLTNLPDPALQKRYKQRTYGDYFSSDALKPEFPVSPLPMDGRPLKTRVIVIQPTDDPASRRVLALDDLLAEATPSFTGDRVTGGGGAVTIMLDGVMLTLRVHPGEHEEPPTVWVTDDQGRPRLIAHAFWFGWFAAWPEMTLERPSARR